MNIAKSTILTLIVITGFMSASAKSYELQSPSGKLSATVDCAKEMTFSVSHDGRTILDPSPISITLTDGTVWGHDGKVSKASRAKVDETIASPFTQSATMRDNYNGLTLTMKGGWAIEFRAYDDGIAYRFVNQNKKPIVIDDEEAEYRFPEDYTATVPYVRADRCENFTTQFFNSFENLYTKTPLSQLDTKRLSFLPLAVELGDGLTMAITETDLNAYPGMYLYNPTGGTSLTAMFAPYPAKMEDGGYNNIQQVVVEAEPFIAKADAPRAFPWRIMVIGSDAEIAATNLSYLLATPSKIADTSWIKPGKVAWDWWNDYNIIGVDFEAGHNTPTYKHYIDFAAENDIEYVILDDGWAAGRGENLFDLNPEIDLKEIIRYAGEKNVGIILWAGYRAFERDLEKVCEHYSKMGVKGFKVDFEDRDDQLMTAFNHRAAEVAAKNRLILDLHGAYKPAGINRTWPNVLNVEGVHGLETCKWTEIKDGDIIASDVVLPYLRCIAGPVDYTQGAMINGNGHNFRAINCRPMSSGSRCHQLALYMTLISPLNMLCDSPSNYRKEQECTDFIAAVPTVWDETRVIDGKMGEYIVTARRSGDTWYIGGITNWTPRDLEIDVTQLGIEPGASLDLFADGANAHRNGNDYKRTVGTVPASGKLNVRLATGGGFAAKIK